MSGSMMMRSFGLAWVLLACALALHVADEALTNFLAVYNPTVRALRAKFPWLPVPVFTFKVWLTGLILGVVLMFSFSGFAFHGAPWLRPIALVLALIMLANGLSHIAGTIWGRKFLSAQFPRPMPGFYSSPFLIAASVYLLIQWKRISCP
jgi:hypothetical protein